MMERPTQEEILEYLRTQRPELTEGQWRKGDPLTIMQWAIPGFVKWQAERKLRALGPLIERGR